VAFAPPLVGQLLLGYAGFFQFFDVTFRGAAQEVEILPNAGFAGTGP
jgi:hypothetical protein